VKTLRLYKFEVEILDDAQESDAEMLKALEAGLKVYMEAVKTVVRLKEASSLQVAVDEFGHPILAEA